MRTLKQTVILLIALFIISPSHSYGQYKKSWTLASKQYKNWTLIDSIFQHKDNVLGFGSIYTGSATYLLAASGIARYTHNDKKIRLLYGDITNGYADSSLWGVTRGGYKEMIAANRVGQILFIIEKENGEDTLIRKKRTDFKNRPPGNYEYKDITNLAFFITNSHKKTILFTDNSPYLNQIVFDDTDTTVLRYDLTEQAPEYKFGLGNAKVRPTVDYKGNYWMTSLNGLLKVEIEATLEQKKLVYKYYSPSDFQGAPNERVLAVQSDSKGNIFVSTQHSAKFFVKEWNSDVFKPITVPDSLMKKDGWGVSKQPIESITLQKNGKLLICFLYHHYCYEYTYSTNTWTRLLEFPMEFKPQYAKEKNEATNIMGPVTFDYENDLLYFHTDQGMLIYDPKASSVESETEGLVPNVYITSIVPNPVYTDGFTANLRCFPDGANNVSAKLYNSLGIELRDFTPNMHIDDLGYCTVNCDTRNLPTGLYIFSLKKGNETTSKNVIILNGK